ncbi:MAG: hypothetical protein NC338_07230 [Firmicutes bacterium]|nr:hypothetical protein [Bacillota bacterium]MCM1401787.1 hypothetical protein [Bacteroides sp.]MCM1477676.1 hypothetical protein [Bacteroides sp.]
MKTFLNIALLFMLTISVIGCSSDSSFAEEPAADDSEMVNFSISVYAGDPEAKPSARSAASRVGSLPGDDYFEDAQNQYERMRTLRVIIVRPDGTVEHNEYLQKTIPAAGLGEYNDIQLRVHGGETKKVYLFANEASMLTSGPGLPPYNFNSIRIGTKFPTEEIAALTLKCDAGQPLIDNTGGNKMYIPMTEQFDIDVRAPKPDGTDLYQSANLFITRAAVKFSFHVQITENPHETFTIEEFQLSMLGNSEYLLPTNCEYVPAKYPVYFADRYIKSYSVPATAVNTACSFYPAITFTPTSPLNTFTDYAPALYFPETALAAGGAFSVKMRLKGDDYYVSSAKLPNLPALPRNTHVKINVTIARADLIFTVDVVPYASVPLNPQFGFDELKPRPPAQPGDVPPWLEIPDPDNPEDN